MIKVQTIFDKVVTRLGINLAESPVAAPDVIQAINDAVKTNRTQLIAVGVFEPFATVVTYEQFTEDEQHPEFNSATMAPKIYQAIPTKKAIVNYRSLISAGVYRQPYFASFNNLARLAYHAALESHAFSIIDETLYVTKQITELVLTYVPEFVDVFELDDDIMIPEVIEDRVVLTTMQLLSVPLGVNLPEQETQEKDQPEQS